MSEKKTTLLCILDGFGLNPNKTGNAVALAKKPNFDRLWGSSPRSTLITCGERVGLPDGQMGNSEVGHLNIGAGRVVEQWLLRINRALEGDFLENSPEFKVFRRSLQTAPHLNLLGLFSDGGVHSHLEHFYKLLPRLRSIYAGEIWIHLVTDGRDTSPTLSLEQVTDLAARIKSDPKIIIKSLSGRFFAMDRDKRWERVKAAYNAIVSGRGNPASDAISAIKASYQAGVTDEFIEPVSFDDRPCSPQDAFLFWNFREDRMREIVRAICLKDFSDFARDVAPPQPESVLCFTAYDHSFHLPFLFPILEIGNHLGEYLAGLGLKQLRVAETEKYPHVTYFFNAGNETAYPLEDRTMVPSPRDVKTYDLKPQMSAEAVCDVVEKAILSRDYNFILVNFANCDMVGHTGVLKAAVTAVETVDTCLGRLLRALDQTGGNILVIADHGNCEEMINPDGSVNTAHSLFPVPIVMNGISGPSTLKDGGALCDVAPTVLKMMNLSIPTEMQGRPLY